MTPLVSVIITTRNRISLLKRAVRSVQEQTYNNIELIVVDDGSEDETAEWCKSQELKYIHIPKEDGKGGNYARNIGIKSSSGEFLAFLDDDDYWLPTKISEQFDAFNIHGESIIYTLRKFEINKGNLHYVEEEDPQLEGNIGHKCLYNGGFTSTSTLFASRKCIFEIGMWDESLKAWQDNDLIIRLSQKYKFYCIKKYLTIYRIDAHDPKKISNKYNAWKESVAYLKSKHRSIIESLSIFEKRELLSFYFREVYLRSIGSSRYRAFKYAAMYALVSPEKVVEKLCKRIISKRMN